MRKKMFASSEAPIFERARELRNSPTPCEDILWQFLKQKPFGFKFRRQHPFSHYILNFYCHALQLVIEVDGKVHERDDVKENDAEREENLKKHGLEILRFKNEVVLNKFDCVRQVIETRLKPKND